MKAILIDDEELALMQLERLLQDDGRYEVSGKYTTARAGLEHLSREHTDVVFLDIGMPGISGLEAAEKIREAIFMYILFISPPTPTMRWKLSNCRHWITCSSRSILPGL